MRPLSFSTHLDLPGVADRLVPDITHANSHGDDTRTLGEHSNALSDLLVGMARHNSESSSPPLVIHMTSAIMPPVPPTTEIADKVLKRRSFQACCAVLNLLASISKSLADLANVKDLNFVM